MKKYKNEIAVGIFIIIAAFIFGYMSITIGKLKLGEGIRVQAIFDNASGVVKDAAVMIAGVDVGSVEKLMVDYDKAVLTLYIKKEAQVKKNVKAIIRAKSLLGEKYVEIVPLSKEGALLSNGDKIINTSTPMEMDQLITRLAPLITDIDADKVKILINTIAKAINGKEKEVGEIILGTARLMSSMDNVQIARIMNNLDSLAGLSEALMDSSQGSIKNIVKNLDKITASLEKDTPAISKNVKTITNDIAKATNTVPGLSKDAEKITKNVVNITDNLNKNTPDIVSKIDNSLAKLPSLLDNVNSSAEKILPLIDKLPPLMDDFSSMAKKADKGLSKLDNINDKDLQKLLEGGRIKVNLF